MAERSYASISDDDLDRLAAIAARDRALMFDANSRWALYRDRVLCVALCQGAALHFINDQNGVKDFDVWTFFAATASRPYPDPALYRRNKGADFGPSVHGARAEDAARGFSGRKVDLLSDSLEVAVGVDPAKALRVWLTRGTRKTPRCLAAKAVILLEPRKRRGEVVWPV